jgi:anti-sigma B factor antagonist
MRIETETRADVCILHFQGRFHTGMDVDYLRAKADELNARGYVKVIADFSEVPYLDSTGIGFVVGLFTHLANRGGRLVLQNPGPRVRQVLDLTRLSGIVPSYPDEASALAALARHASGEIPTIG